MEMALKVEISVVALEEGVLGGAQWETARVCPWWVTLWSRKSTEKDLPGSNVQGSHKVYVDEDAVLTSN